MCTAVSQREVDYISVIWFINQSVRTGQALFCHCGGVLSSQVRIPFLHILRSKVTPDNHIKTADHKYHISDWFILHTLVNKEFL